jgi:hypothetical protein
MHRLHGSLAFLITTAALFGCASRGGFPPDSWRFPIDGDVHSISRSDLAAAIAEANADRIWRVHVIDRNHVRVDISDDWHEGPDYEHLGHSVRFHGEPMYVIVTRVHGRWESGGAVVSTY